MTENKMTNVNDALLVASFRLGDAVFGIDAQHVQEVSKVGEITRVHHAAADVVGIRNLRGRIVTVIDLRACLRLGQVEASPENRVLIVDWQGEPIGLLVDSVTDMITVGAGELAPPPPNLHGVQGDNIRGICQGGGRLIALLDPVALFAEAESSRPAVSRTAASL